MIERGILQEGAPRFKSAGLIEDASLFVLLLPSPWLLCVQPLSQKPRQMQFVMN